MAACLPRHNKTSFALRALTSLPSRAPAPCKVNLHTRGCVGANGPGSGLFPRPQREAMSAAAEPACATNSSPLTLPAMFGAARDAVAAAAAAMSSKGSESAALPASDDEVGTTQNIGGTNYTVMKKIADGEPCRACGPGLPTCKRRRATCAEAREQNKQCSCKPRNVGT